MPDATGEWLVEFVTSEQHTVYERFRNVNDAIPFLHKVLGMGQRPRLYRETPITLTIDVGGEAPVKAPRKRRKTPPPADKPGSDTPTGPGNGEAGELKEGAAGPVAQDVALAQRGESGQGAAPGATASNLASPFYYCEAVFDHDVSCPGDLTLDPVSRGWFCPIHIGIPESNRREFHRRHASRNRPVRVAG
jgi:hypothetical protein